MKFFRAPELAFWAAAVIAMLALAIFAATRGGEAVDGGESTVPISAPAASASQAREQVNSLLALMPTGIAAGTDATALTDFAAAVRTQAEQGAAIRSSEGAPDDDQMLAGFNRAADDANRLTTRANDPVAATALRTQIGLDVDHLHRLAIGQPAPELPATGLDPFSGIDQPTTPEPQTPNRPTTPTLGAKP